MNPALDVNIWGVGLWSRGLTSFAEFTQAMHKDYADLANASFVSPKPDAIPPKERRRAGLMINLAVAVAHQACEHANVDKTLVPSVFVSAMGDTAITDYMCRKLAAPEKLLSPTKFHNSVHNAPSGYWTISANNRAPSSFVGVFEHSVGAGLLEAASQAVALATPVLVVFYDIANNAPFSQLYAIDETLATAFVIAPADLAVPAAVTPLSAQLSYQARQPGELVSNPRAPALQHLVQGNPVGASLALVEQFAAAQQGGLRSPSLQFGLSATAWLQVQHQTP